MSAGRWRLCSREGRAPPPPPAEQNGFGRDRPSAFVAGDFPAWLRFRRPRSGRGCREMSALPRARLSIFASTHQKRRARRCREIRRYPHAAQRHIPFGAVSPLALDGAAGALAELPTGAAPKFKTKARSLQRFSLANQANSARSPPARAAKPWRLPRRCKTRVRSTTDRDGQDSCGASDSNAPGHVTFSRMRRAGTTTCCPRRALRSCFCRCAMHWHGQSGGAVRRQMADKTGRLGDPHRRAGRAPEGRRVFKPRGRILHDGRFCARKTKTGSRVSALMRTMCLRRWSRGNGADAWPWRFASRFGFGLRLRR